MLIKRHLQATCAAAVLLALPAGVMAAPGEDQQRAREVLDRLASISRLGPAVEPLNRAAALDRILGGLPYPGRCATPLLLAIHQAGLDREGPASVLFLGLGPGIQDDLRILTGPREGLPGSFRLRFSTLPEAGGLDPEDGDLDGAPDEAWSLLERLEEARVRVLAEFERTGAPLPWPAGAEPRHEVLVTLLPAPLEGYVWPGREGSVLLLDREALRSPGGELLLSHQMAHLFQLSLSTDEPPWWYEAHAIWTEDPSGLHAADRGAEVSTYLADGRSGLGTDLLAAWEGTFLWPHYLAATGDGGRLPGMIWEDLAAVPGENLREALEALLARTRGTTLSEEVRSFRIWNLFLGEFDDGAHYPFAHSLPATLGSFVRSYPAFWRGNGDVAPLGGATVQLAATGLPGGWLLEFSGEVGANWDLTLVTVPARLDRRPGLATIEVEDGRGSAGIPWGEMDSVIAVVQNLGGERDEPSRFFLSARHDPLVPFDLMSLAPEEQDGVVAIRWHTEREIDLLGWRVYRSRDPLSGYEPVNRFLMPAAGGPEMASYVFLDDGVRPGRKYYYILEGITRHGFTETTHPVSVRVRRKPR